MIIVPERPPEPDDADEPPYPPEDAGPPPDEPGGDAGAPQG
jgi:hypothetical protein